MSTVSFPGLGLTFELNRVAFSIGGFHVYWYGVIIAVGFVLAVWFCLTQAKKFGVRTDDFLDMLLFAAPGGIIGARLYYIIFYSELYRNADGSLNLKACLNIHNGGLAIYGGIIAGTLIAWLVARYKKIPFPALVDLCAFGLLIGQCAGRWGILSMWKHTAAQRSFPGAWVLRRPGSIWKSIPRFSTSRCGTWLAFCCCCGFCKRDCVPLMECCSCFM